MAAKSITLLVSLLLSVSVCQAADWEVANNGLVGYSVADVIIDYSNPNVLYCSFKDGVYKTTNGGASWTKTGTLGTTPSAKKLAMDPTNPLRIYVQASDANGAYVWRTENGGSTWVKKGTGITLPYIATVEVSKSQPNIVYCGTVIGGREGGCYKSTDYGDTWVLVAGSNMAGSGLGNDCCPIAIDPTNPDNVYCGFTHYNNFLTSTDGGYHWTSRGQWFDVRAILIDPANPSRVVIGGEQHLRLSTNNGSTFTEKLSGLEIQALAAAPSNPNIFYATTTDNGIYKSADSGLTWAQVSGSEKYGYGKFAIHPTDPNTLYLVVPGRGVAKSTDGGHTIAFINSGLPKETNVSMIHPQPGGRAVYAMVNYVGLYRTYDDGATWQFLSSVPYFPKGFSICRDNPNVIYYVASPLDKIMKSTDGGLNWNPIPSPPGGDTTYTAVAVNPTNPDHILAAGYPSTKVYTTLNGGQSWQATLTVTYMPDWWSTSVGGFTFDPTNPNRVYASTYSYPRRSTDGGLTWTTLSDLHYTVMYGSPNPVPKDTSSVRHIAVDPVTPNVLYASTQWGGTWKSTDYGDHWTMIHNPILDVTNNTVVDSRDHNTLWLTSLGYSGLNTGVWKSTDAGASWTRVSSGLTGNDLYPSWISQSMTSPERLYLGCQIKGVYRTPGPDWGLTVEQAMGLPDGAYCMLSQDQIVSLTYPSGWGCVQEENRLRGIRVSNTGNVAAGDKVHISGTVKNDGSGKYMVIDQATVVGAVEPPKALSMGAKAANQAGAPSGVYSRAWGRVNGITGSSFYLDDGSGTVDGTGNAGIRVDASRISELRQDTFAVVEGILDKITDNGKTIPSLVPLSADGIITGSIVNFLQNSSFETGTLEMWSSSGTGIESASGSWHFDIQAHSGNSFIGAYGYNTVHSGVLCQRATVVPNTSCRASVWSRVFHAGNDADSAINRIGIDPTGGTDPASPTVQWSDWDMQPSWYYSYWVQISTPVVSVNGSMCTVFLEYRQQNPTSYHINCFDDARLEAAQ